MQETVERMFAVAGMNRHRDMDCDWPRLPQPMHTIVALFLYGGVPPAGKMKHVGGGREREAYSGGLGTKDENVETTVVV